MPVTRLFARAENFHLSKSIGGEKDLRQPHPLMRDHSVVEPGPDANGQHRDQKAGDKNRHSQYEGLSDGYRPIPREVESVTSCARVESEAGDDQHQPNLGEPGSKRDHDEKSDVKRIVRQKSEEAFPLVGHRQSWPARRRHRWHSRGRRGMKG